MKKLIVLVAMLVLATMAFAQQSYVSSEYTGYNTPRATADSVLGFHDVLAGPTGDNTQNAVQRNGCQSCHVPHGAKVTDSWTDSNSVAHTGGMYIWKYNVPTNIVGQDEKNITLDAASFHTLACLSCHDGATATDVIANNTIPSYVQVAADGLMNDHPVNQILPIRSSGLNSAQRKFVRFYTPSGQTMTTAQAGYVECGSCHDPHKGDANTYDFLRGPGSTVTVTGTSVSNATVSIAPTTYAQMDNQGNVITYTGTSPQWARLGLCRDCHGK